MHAYGRRGRARAGEPRCDYTCTHRDGKCSQCTNLRRSPLERGRPALGTRRSARTYVRMCVSASTRARPSGAKPRKLVYLGRAFFQFRTTSTFRGIFSVCSREIPRTNRFVFPCVRAALTVLSNGLCTPLRIAFSKNSYVMELILTYKRNKTEFVQFSWNIIGASLFHNIRCCIFLTYCWKKYIYFYLK